MNKLDKLTQKAEIIVAQVVNNPENRYNLRYEFYEKYGHSVIKGSEGLGNSELAFIKWEIKRGVLNPLSATPSGSEWWRAVNSYFLYVGTLAQLIHESGEDFKDLPTPVTFWLAYINEPNECTWYRAHNSSIIEGYAEANKLALKENVYEQYFMNIVLYRLLYAQSMVEGVSFGILGKIFANPRGYAVSIITDIEAFYPGHYPLTKEDIKYVMHKAHNCMGILEDIFDYLFIIPHLEQLYKEAAKWNTTPVLTSFIAKNKPVYPLHKEKNEDILHFSKQFTTQEIQLTN